MSERTYHFTLPPSALESKAPNSGPLIVVQPSISSELRTAFASDFSIQIMLRARRFSSESRSISF